MITADVARITELLVGCSPAIQHLRELVARLAPVSLPVLIEGPTGVGKELVARALHVLSGRRGSHVALNVCAVPEAMFEATLFGHVKGAFTGAVSDAPGYVSEAHDGTLFLDEIGGLPLVAQPKLLRVLETRQYRPVGGRTDRRSEFRVVAASNEELQGLVSAGRFRADLAQRLSGFVVRIPPLAARPEDVRPLAEHFLGQVERHHRAIITEGAARLLEDQPWRGNVRELRQVVERAIVMADGPVIDSASVVAALSPLDCGDGFASVRRESQRRELRRLLDECGWDTACVAERIGAHRATVYRRMQRLGIDPKQSRDVARPRQHHLERPDVPLTRRPSVA